VIGDLLSGRKPEIDLDGLTIARYRSPTASFSAMAARAPIG
jgi:hypothetical protein